MNKIESFKCSKCGCKTFYVDIILQDMTLLDVLLRVHTPIMINVICSKCGSSYNPLRDK